MTLGILSDTHGYLHPSLPEVLGGVDLILHAGDVGRVAVLTMLEGLAPVQAVWGNVDGPDVRCRTTRTVRTELEGVRILMTHIGGRPGRWDRSVVKELRTDPPDLFICGHSHILRIERVRDPEDMLYINPGAAGRQGFHLVRTCIRLRLAAGSTLQAEVVHLDE